MFLQVDGDARSSSSPLFSDTTKPAKFFSWNKDGETSKNNEKI